MATSPVKADDDNRWRPGAIVIRNDHSAGRWPNTQAAEVVAGNVFSGCYSGLAPIGERQLPASLITEKAGEGGAVLPYQFEGGIREGADGEFALVVGETVVMAI